MFETNNFKIYDVIAHRSYIVNKNDINITKTIKDGYPYFEYVNNHKHMCGYALVFVHENAVKKTPNYEGGFAVSNKTYKKITSIPRKNW